MSGPAVQHEARRTPALAAEAAPPRRDATPEGPLFGADVVDDVGGPVAQGGLGKPRLITLGAVTTYEHIRKILRRLFLGQLLG